MPMSLIEHFTAAFHLPLPLHAAPLVQCLTNEISVESVANALLAINAKPVMADDLREITGFMAQSDAVLLNLGHLSADREASIRLASQAAQAQQRPVVIDLVGIGASPIRAQLGQQLLAEKPMVVKGNLGELRHLVGLPSQARGVDNSQADSADLALAGLAHRLQTFAQAYPHTVFLATGPTDIVATATTAWRLDNGVAQLDRFTGTGDIVGALIAALLGSGLAALPATVLAVSYFNRCGEAAALLASKAGLATFRLNVFDQLSQLGQDPEWFLAVKGENYGS
ncbi:hydroxyethylthiazole kinase [Lacticaseibacillus baoqingensis]|uniref:Hydroxyethylthiazole kinase n=1 Tax=Lacticaseibacillus baoqingensis TaxID=2486013 RepID=A0ABW4E966_9LACO|nr:hydroxyethylthiazole kinase [Lacticaseibacillus baoqingensis]